jgi:hypothetical protein
MKQPGDRVSHTWQITGQTVYGTVREETVKEGERAWRIEYEQAQKLPGSDAEPATEITVKLSDIAAWPTVS